MRDALLFLSGLAFGWLLGYLAGAARTRTLLRSPSREDAPKSASSPADIEALLTRKIEIALRRTSPSGLGLINLHVVCLLCEMDWTFTKVGFTDNVWLNCPRCGARETSDDVRAALRAELRKTLADAPPEIR